MVLPTSAFEPFLTTTRSATLSWPRLERPNETLSVGAQWVISAQFDSDFVYALTKALWNPRNRIMLDGGHAKARLIQLGTALDGVSTPLHPGAERYYREIGLKLPGDLPTQ